jgi:Prokaryotic Cytochrome C oxidase subunit IV
MKKKDIYTLAILILFTALTALLSNIFNGFKFITIVIMLLSGIKFLLVAFQFMELKKANNFWKISLSTYLILFFTSILLIIYSNFL